MTHRNKIQMCKKNRRQGLILLIVLGMLAMFSLLAVTYVVTTSSSKNASVAMVTRARSGNITIDGTTNSVASMMIRGTNDQSSAFYKHSLLEDIYSPNPLRSRFGNTNQGSLGFQADWCRLLSPTSPLISVNGPNFVKVSLLNDDPDNNVANVVNGPLSKFENEYNSRFLTVLEGPLAGQTFRIWKYVGFVRSNLSSGESSKPDPNVASIGTWSNPSYQDTEWYKTEYSVLIDLSEARGTLFTGQFINGSGRTETVSLTIADWVTKFGVSSLFFLRNGAIFNGYSFVINDVAFNNAGIGMSDVASKPAPPTNPPTVPPVFQGFGTLDGREYIKQSSTGKPSIPPAFLPNYDYLNNPNYMQIPVNGIGISQRTSSTQNLLNGASNEGYDVADWRDFWLAHLSYVSGNPVPNVIPSFHRPELVNYISNLFGAPSSLTFTDVEDMVRLIDASTARILRYNLSGSALANTNFRSNVDPNPALTSITRGGTFGWSSPPTGQQVLDLQAWVARQITGPWDFDNDRDGIPDSVFINPGLPASYSPDGRMLRPIASVMIQDLDSRVNINTAGDRTQGLTGFDLAPNALVHKKQTLGATTSQGFGYGPAEISLTSVFLGNLSLLRSSASSFSLFDDRYGARRYVRRPLDYTETAMDRVPGRRALTAAFGANDNFSQYMERELHFPSLVTVPSGRRSSFATEIDRNGNLSFVQQSSADADPYNPASIVSPSEIMDDPYEMAALEKTNSDDPFGLADLAAILLRYEGDSSSLPKRLRDRLAQLPAYSDTSAVNGLITTRSAELRYPNLVAAQKFKFGSEDWIDHQATSLHKWIFMLHKQRYQKAGDPDLTRRSLEELFSTDFSKGLRMDLNRPFGNGFDDDGDGQIDDPEEIATVFQDERFSRQDGTTILNQNGGDYYYQELYTSMGGSGVGSRGRLASRQIFARNIYCLAQLIVPRDFLFNGMTSATLDEPNARIRAAALAQWAANVVDFRDSDAAMTRFEYDIFPFGNPAVGSLPAKAAFWAPDHLEQASNKNFVGVVWGLEMPELLLTETLALHDKGQRDTDLEAASGKVYSATDTNLDPDFDQYRFPLASLFLEVYATRSADTAVSSLPSNVVLPGTAVDPLTVNSFANREGMYVNHMGQVKLDLERLAPLNGTWGRQPVWRVAVTEYDSTTPKNFVTTPSNLKTVTHQSGTSASINGVSWPASSNSPDDVTGSGLQFDVVDKSKRPVDFDRIIWFSSTAPGASQIIPDLKSTIVATDHEHAVYYNRSGTPAYLAGGSFMVVGPRAVTPIGSATHSRATSQKWNPILLRSEVVTAKPTYSPSYQRIDLTGGTAETRLLNDTLANEPWTNLANGRIKSPVSIFCGAKPPTDPLWTTAFPNGIGINVSLPNPIVSGNPIWSTTNAPSNKIDTSFPLPDSWIDVSSGSVVGTLKDRPFDDVPPVPLPPTVANTEIAKLGDPKPLGTYESIKSVYLQRLADPDIGYDPVSNPYITVDWMPVDLTVFNGEAPADPTQAKPTKFQSRYKNGSYAQGTTSNSDGSSTGASYLSPITGTFSDSQSQPDPATQYRSYFQHQLGYRTPLPDWAGFLGNSGTTLGYANSGFASAGYLTLAQMSLANGSGINSIMDGFGPPTSTNDAGTAVSAAYVGATRNLTSIPWFNRPFASPHELRLVPTVGPGQIGFFHSSPLVAKKPFSFLHDFGTSNAVNTEEGSPNRSFWLNPSSDLDTMSPPTIESDLHLLFELVETQPPFADAARAIQPDTINTMISTAVSANDNVALRFLNSSVPPNYYGTSVPALVRGTGLLPPFNTLSNYVNAGKINVNTIGEDLAGNAPALKAIENNFLDQGLRTIPNDPIQTQFMTSRRGFPLPSNWTSTFFSGSSLPYPPLDANFPTQFAGAYRPASSANLVPYVQKSAARQKMRGKLSVETTLARSLNPTTSTIYANPVKAAAVNTYNGEPAMFSTSTETNSFGYHQRSMRLPNLISNQSNVFAVWVTVSLYEYDPIQGFGNEYLDERGEPKSERMFYIIDRTMPVGFKPGENLNTDRTILYQRKLN